MNLRKLARGKPCLVRLPGCDGGSESGTTVGAHYRSISLGAGVALKTDDIFIGWACYPCHKKIDGEAVPDYTRAEVRLAHAESVLRTIKQLLDSGYIHIGRKEPA